MSRRVADEMLTLYGREVGRKPAAPVQARPVEPMGDVIGSTKYSTDSPVKVLAHAVDTFWFHGYGELKEHWEILLEEGKKEAITDKSLNGDGRALSWLPPLYGECPVVLNHGAKGYEWLLELAGVEIKIRRASSEGDPRPLIVFRLGQEVLWRYGWQEAIAAGRQWLNDVLVGMGEIKCGGIHVCADFQGYVPSADDADRVLTRADSITVERENRRGLGLDRKRVVQIAAGRSTRLRASLYNKSRQARNTDKQWFFRLWERIDGYNSAQEVWRLEFQFGREFLNRHDIHTVTEVLAALPDLWSYGLRWFSLRVENQADSNLSRWQVDPVWLALARLADGFTRGLSQRVTLSEQVDRRRKRHEDAIMGHLSSLMVLYGEKEASEAFTRCVWRWERGHNPFGDTLDKRYERKVLQLAGLLAAA